MSEAYFKEVNALKGPVFSILKKEGYQAVDMHYHTRFSIDGLAPISKVIAKCKKDVIGIGVSDHNNIKGSFKAKKIAGKSVFFIPGIEVTCHNGVHILLHFYVYNELKEFFDKNLKKKIAVNPWFIDLNHNEVVDLASKYNCLITAPHPFGPGFIGIKKFKPKPQTIRKIHAIEAINGCCIGDMNTKAIAWGKKINKGFTGGSDGHCLAELGTSLTVCKADTVEEFLDQIKKKKSIVIGKEEQLLDDAVHSVEKFIREEEKAPHKQLEKMWKDRGLLEWNYFKKKIMDISFLHHFHSHHHEINKGKLAKHKHTKHLIKYL
jgi:predicted metal-dependent phosphoesterase TrpH